MGVMRVFYCLPSTSFLVFAKYTVFAERNFRYANGEGITNFLKKFGQFGSFGSIRIIKTINTTNFTNPVNCISSM